jgi:hypothetical protein
VPNNPPNMGATTTTTQAQNVPSAPPTSSPAAGPAMPPLPSQTLGQSVTEDEPPF